MTTISEAAAKAGMSTGRSLLDLCCKQGGAGYGYRLAGFTRITGVDIDPQPRYPFEFLQADALEVLEDAAFLAQFDAIHASWPCQAFSVSRNIRQGPGGHPDLITPGRELMRASGKPYVIENVPGAPLISPVTVCGLALGLNVKRHREFEASFDLGDVPPCPPGHPGDWVTVFGGGAPAVPDSRRRASAQQARAAMDISWMTRDGLAQAVPPGYTRLIGQRLLAVLA